MSLDAVAQDAQWMRLALAQAQFAADAGEVPVGAVLVCNGELLAVGRNAPIHSHDPSAHAEMLAMRSAAARLKNYRLTDCTLFVTLEPCPMCAGAMLHARLKRVVFGAADPKTGAAGSVLNLFANTQLNHQTQVQGGILAQQCAAVLQDFFKSRRQMQQSAASPLREDALRTPLSRFEDLAPMPGLSHYINDLPALQGLRLHYVDAGPPEASRVSLCLHGSQSWSQAWRTVMAERVAAGERVLALDLPGFGKSDKPKKPSLHSLQWHAQVLMAWLERLNLPSVLLLESQADALRFPTTDANSDLNGSKTLGEVLLHLSAPRIHRRESCLLTSLSRSEMNAPYPDQGHRAAMRALSWKK
ncbi:MAG: CMP/dCMP deaminase [Comamonadaceae bacterium]|nr:MAG: CMP/dCMP deaminase [Comamonadaceae bacterium]